jgi:hypothetical protein
LSPGSRGWPPGAVGPGAASATRDRAASRG